MRSVPTVALVALVALAVAAGCAPGKSTLDVTAGAAVALANVDHLRVQLTDAAGKKAMEIDVPVPDGAIPPTVSFALRFPSTVKGKVTLAVDAMPASGAPVAGAVQDLDIQPSQRKAVVLQLSPGAHPTQLAFMTQPSDAAVAAAIKPAVQVAVQDSTGALVSADNIMVTLALGDNPSGATLGGTLTAATVGGIAGFADLKLDKTGDGYTLTASADLLSSATSAPFKITPPAWVSVDSGLYGGFINRLLVDPKHTATIYAATRSGAGVWKTIDSGAHWTAASAGLPIGSEISDIAIDPVTTTTLYAMAANLTAQPSDGIYKTVDGGATWTRLASGATGSPYGHIVVDPTNTQIVTIAVSRTISRSTNGGTTFNPLTATITYGAGVRDMTVDSFGTVWIACYGDGIQKIANNATTFTEVGGSAGNPLPTGHSSCCYYTAVGVEPNAASYVYASRDSGTPGMFTYRTINSGADWTALSVGQLAAFAFGPGAGGTTIRYAIFLASRNVIYSSTDGTTWNQLGANVGDSALGIAVVDSSNIFLGSGSGVFKLVGTAWQLNNTGMTANPVNALAVDPKNGNTVFAGLTTLGQVRTTDGGASWSPPAAAGAIPNTSPIYDLAIDDTDSQLVWAASGFPYRSTDGGTTWTQVAGGGASGRAIAAAPSMSGTFWLGGNGNAYSIAAASAMWSTAGSGLPASIDSAAIVVHPTNPMIVYNATVSGGVYGTTNGGAAWTARNSGLGSMTMTALAIDRMTPNTLFAGTDDKGLFKSTDAAANWAPANSGLTSMAVSAVAIARSNPQIIYVGTRGAGVFRSGDGGATWVANSAGLPSLYITRLAIDATNPQLVYAGTIDGGVAKTVP